MSGCFTREELKLSKSILDLLFLKRISEKTAFFPESLQMILAFLKHV